MNNQNLVLKSLTAGNGITLSKIRYVGVYIPTSASATMGDGVGSVLLNISNKMFEIKADEGNTFDTIIVTCTVGSCQVQYY
jgi:hypothetical protein